MAIALDGNPFSGLPDDHCMNITVMSQLFGIEDRASLLLVVAAVRGSMSMGRAMSICRPMRMRRPMGGRHRTTHAFACELANKRRRRRDGQHQHCDESHHTTAHLQPVYSSQRDRTINER